MPYTLVAVDKRDYVLFIGEGSIQGTDEYFAWCQEAAKNAFACGRKRSLSDERNLSLEISQIDILDVAERLLAEGLQTKGMRLAILPSANQPGMHRFIETVFTNRSTSIKVFDSREEALKWLLA